MTRKKGGARERRPDDENKRRKLCVAKSFVRFFWSRTPVDALHGRRLSFRRARATPFIVDLSAFTSLSRLVCYHVCLFVSQPPTHTSALSLSLLFSQSLFLFLSLYISLVSVIYPGPLSLRVRSHLHLRKKIKPMYTYAAGQPNVGGGTEIKPATNWNDGVVILSIVGRHEQNVGPVCFGRFAIR